MFQKIKDFLFKNTSAKQTVAKNTFWLSVSNFGGRLVKAVIIIYAARVLGTAGYGLFSYAVTVAAFLTLCMDPGITTILAKESAKATPEERYGLFSTVFIIKIALILLGVAIVIFAGPLFSTLPGATTLLPIIALIMMFDTLREFFLGLLHGMEKMEWDAVAYIITNIAIVIFGFIFIFYRPTAASLGWGYAIGTGIGAVIAAGFVWPYIKRTFTSFSKKLVVPLLTAAWPFAIIGVLGLLLTNMDVLILSWMRTASEVGIYAAAIRIVQMLYLVPGIFQLSTLPIFSRLANVDNKRFRDVFERTLGMLFLISIPLAAGGIVFGTQVILLVFGPYYIAGGTTLRVLMVSMIFDFPATILAGALLSFNHQRSLIITSAIAGITNVAFDLLLIPRFGITGSAVATLIAQTVSNAYLWYILKKVNYFTIIPRLHKIIASALVMAAAGVAFIYLGIPIVINLVLCAVIYFVLLKLFNEPLFGEALHTLGIRRSAPAVEAA